MRILVCGGTGFIGRHIVDSLKQAGHEPVQRSRRTAPLDFSKALTAEAWLPHLAGIDAVINAVGVLRDSAGRPLQIHACRRPHRAVRRLRGGGRAASGADLGPGHRAQRHALRQHQARRRRASAGADGAGAVERLRAASQRGVRRRRRQQPAVPGPGAPAGPAAAARGAASARAARGRARPGRRGGARGGFGCAVGPGRDRRTRGPAAGAVDRQPACADGPQAGLCRPAARLVEPGQRARRRRVAVVSLVQRNAGAAGKRQRHRSGRPGRWLGRPGVAPGQLLATLRRD